MTADGRLRAALKACRGERFEVDCLKGLPPSQILAWVERRKPAWTGKDKESVRACAVLSELEDAAKACAYPHMGVTIRHEHHRKAGHDCPPPCPICDSEKDTETAHGRNQKTRREQ
jgi:hypothetical protein